MKKEKEKTVVKLAEEFQTLKELFEERIERTIKTEDDCKVVGDFLNENPNDAFHKKEKRYDGYFNSLKTLKRVFGILPYSGKFNDTTLNQLTRALGFRDWDDYRNQLPKYKLSKEKFDGLFNPDKIVVSKLKEGEIITIGWKPIRFLDAKYLGDFKFEVIEGNLQKQKRGETFHAKKFFIDYSFYADLDISPIEEGYPCLPKIYISMNEEAENIIG
jgi:hypothetical protein